MDYDVWINKAIMKVGEIEIGKTFILKDLFLGTEWNELAKGEKLTLGHRFHSTVENDKTPDISVTELPKGASTTYQKIKWWRF